MTTPTKTKMKHKADRLFSLKVRARGRCEAPGFDSVPCSGFLQTAHLVPRRYLSVRWKEGNAACLCAAHHVYLTYYPLAHERFCRQYLGDDQYEELKYQAEAHTGAPDYPAVLEGLK
jgi:hypothetical protein